MAHTRKHRREQNKERLKATRDSGGVAGKINRARKKLKSASKEDLTLFKKKNKVNKVDPKQFDSRRIKKIDATQFDSRKSKSKSTMTATERAKAIAKKRIASGKTIKDVKAANTKSMKDAAKKRNEAFKKTGKSTIEQRRAAAKKKMQDAARKRNEAFKKKRAKK